MAHKNDFRMLEQLAEQFGFKFAGRTSNGHCRWTHTTNGRLVVSVSKIDGDRRTLANTKRTFKLISGQVPA